MPQMTKIGVFYDGNYFLHVSNYYNYDHPRKRRLSISGLHEFVRNHLAQLEKTPVELCRIVDAHYFRGRLSAQEAYQRGSALYWDRVFDDILMSGGVTTHYMPLKNVHGRKEEKGIDVWLALEAYESVLQKKLDVLVLIASDGDYTQLVRKVNTLGCRVMIMSWDFEFTTDNGKDMVTRTAQDLLEEASYPVPMHRIIDDRMHRNDPVINNLFVPGNESKRNIHPRFDDRADDDYDDDKGSEFLEEPMEGEVGEVLESKILSLKNGYGFIKYPPNNLFFHYTSVKNVDFNDLLLDDTVEFTLDRNDEGQLIATDVSLIEDDIDDDEDDDEQE